MELKVLGSSVKDTKHGVIGPRILSGSLHKVISPRILSERG